MTLGEAAKLINCSEQTMRVYADKGRIDSTRIGPRGWRLFERTKVEAFAEAAAVDADAKG